MVSYSKFTPLSRHERHSASDRLVFDFASPWRRVKCNAPATLLQKIALLAPHCGWLHPVAVIAPEKILLHSVVCESSHSINFDRTKLFAAPANLPARFNDLTLTNGN
jgi:hypothetical protein